MIFNTTIYKAGEGGGAGTELVVPTLGSVQTAEVNTKVLLVYANEVGGTDVTVQDSTSNIGSASRIRGQYGSTFDNLAWGNGTAYCKLIPVNGSYLTSWASGGNANFSYWDTDPSISISNNWSYPSTDVGFGPSSAFVQKYSTGTTNTCLNAFHGVVGGFVTSYERFGRINNLGFIYNSETQSFYQKGLGDGCLFIRYDNHPCLVDLPNNTATVIDEKTGADLQVISITGSDYLIPGASRGYPLTPSGDYFVVWSNAWNIGLFKLTKTPSWSVTRLTTLPSTQSGAVQLIRASEDLTSLHCYVVPETCDDTNNVKHYIINKETGEVNQGQDLLNSKGYDTVMAAAFNTNMSRASFVLKNSTTGDAKCFVSGLEVILPYEYAAVAFNRDNLTDSAVTGFIKSQDGTDELGNPIATVEALLDPNAMPPSTDRLIGMNVTVNEGEPL